MLTAEQHQETWSGLLSKSNSPFPPTMMRAADSMPGVWLGHRLVGPVTFLLLLVAVLRWTLISRVLYYVGFSLNPVGFSLGLYNNLFIILEEEEFLPLLVEPIELVTNLLLPKIFSAEAFSFLVYTVLSAAASWLLLLPVAIVLYELYFYSLFHKPVGIHRQDSSNWYWPEVLRFVFVRFENRYLPGRGWGTRRGRGAGDVSRGRGDIDTLTILKQLNQRKRWMDERRRELEVGFSSTMHAARDGRAGAGAVGGEAGKKTKKTKNGPSAKNGDHHVDHHASGKKHTFDDECSSPTGQGNKQAEDTSYFTTLAKRVKLGLMIYLNHQVDEYGVDPRDLEDIDSEICLAVPVARSPPPALEPAPLEPASESTSTTRGTIAASRPAPPGVLSRKGSASSQQQQQHAPRHHRPSSSSSSPEEQPTAADNCAEMPEGAEIKCFWVPGLVWPLHRTQIVTVDPSHIRWMMKSDNYRKVDCSDFLYVRVEKCSAHWTSTGNKVTVNRRQRDAHIKICCSSSCFILLLRSSASPAPRDPSHSPRQGGLFRSRISDFVFQRPHLLISEGEQRRDGSGSVWMERHDHFMETTAFPALFRNAMKLKDVLLRTARKNSAGSVAGGGMGAVGPHGSLDDSSAASMLPSSTTGGAAHTTGDGGLATVVDPAANGDHEGTSAEKRGEANFSGTSGSGRTPLNLSFAFQRFALDSIMEIGFSHKPNYLEQAAGAPLESEESLKREFPFLWAYDTAAKLAQSRVSDPFWVIKKFFNLGSERVLRRVDRELRKQVKELVVRALRRAGQGGEDEGSGSRSGSKPRADSGSGGKVGGPPHGGGASSARGPANLIEYVILAHANERKTSERSSSHTRPRNDINHHGGRERRGSADHQGGRLRKISDRLIPRPLRKMAEKNFSHLHGKWRGSVNYFTEVGVNNVLMFLAGWWPTTATSLLLGSALQELYRRKNAPILLKLREEIEVNLGDLLSPSGVAPSNDVSAVSSRAGSEHDLLTGAPSAPSSAASSVTSSADEGAPPQDSREKRKDMIRKLYERFSFESHRFQYLYCVLKETLRLHPPVAVDVRVAKRGDWMPCSPAPDGKPSPKVFVPRNAAVVHDLYAQGRQSWIYGKTAAEFRPERWLVDDAVEGATTTTTTSSTSGIASTTSTTGVRPTNVKSARSAPPPVLHPSPSLSSVSASPTDDEGPAPQRGSSGFRAAFSDNARDESPSRRIRVRALKEIANFPDGPADVVIGKDDGRVYRRSVGSDKKSKPSSSSTGRSRRSASQSREASTLVPQTVVEPPSFEFPVYFNAARRRTRLGLRFAYMEAKVCLAVVLHFLEVSIDHGGGEDHQTGGARGGAGGEDSDDSFPQGRGAERVLFGTVGPRRFF